MLCRATVRYVVLNFSFWNARQHPSFNRPLSAREVIRSYITPFPSLPCLPFTSFASLSWASLSPPYTPFLPFPSLLFSSLLFIPFPLFSSLLFIPLSVALFSYAVVPLEMVKHVVVTRCTKGNGRGDKCEGWAYDVIGEEEELEGIGEIVWCSGC